MRNNWFQITCLNTFRRMSCILQIHAIELQIEPSVNGLWPEGGNNGRLSNSRVFMRNIRSQITRLNT